MAYSAKTWEKSHLPGERTGKRGPCPPLRSRSKGILDTVYKEVQVLVTSHVHETDLRKHSQGLKFFIDIVTQRRWNRPYSLNLLWLIVCLKTTITKIIQRILIGFRLSQQIFKMSRTQITWLTKKQQNLINSQGKTINRCQPRWTRCYNYQSETL